MFRANGNLLVSDFQGDVHEFNSAGAPLGVFAAGAGAAGLTFGPDGNLYVGSFSQDSVRRYDGANGAFIDVFVSAGSGGLNGSDGVTFGPDGNLYVSSRSTNQVLRYNGATGAFIDVFTSGAAPNPPVDLQFGPDGNLAVVSAISSEDVKRYNGATGVFIDTYAAGSGIDTPTHFTFTHDSDGDGVLDPDDICPDTSIPEGVPTVNLNPNHWALVDDDFDFDTVSSGEGRGPGRGYTTTDTAGCSCEQIIEALDLGIGHTKFGCSISAMDEWVELVNP